ncbi:MAG: isoprenylcysteine carboxylmethyltransferase family protein [Magnetospirillum sp.]|nr:isoprenylcysteine carboxylmethyltransferase family protein [Magnetospirillum sp.]
MPAAVGVALILWAAALMRRQGTTLHPHGQATVLVTSGPFAFSRNPIYLGFALVLLGLAAGLGSSAPWAVLTAWVFAMERLFIRREEEALAARFGPAFAAYAERVRRWF